ncbi:MAG: hypothetical protein WKF61_01235 [Luteimonas sp.]
MAAYDYYSGWEQETFACDKCGWRGLGAECVQGEMFRDFVERQCPRCPDENLFLLMFPTLDESHANWDKVSPGDKAFVRARESFLQNLKCGC